MFENAKKEVLADLNDRLNIKDCGYMISVINNEKAVDNMSVLEVISRYWKLRNA